ncbi:sulfotransferase family 2 domain-containing protein [Aestuariibius insulae]|uniref:sulfotransferase family 2 domain-containing protein n=1 Tax=Aestuariibius insulae TaxID=2058287 RepID=UPI00345E3692
MTKFNHFAILADMRTGSNFLEANLNAVSGIACHGELFNPHFVGYPNKDTVFDIDLNEREKAPGGLLEDVKSADGLNGFRFFHDHDPRIRDQVLRDPACAKIILTRNMLDSYVSLKIAEATGQWMLTNANHHKDVEITFDPEDFETYLSEVLTARDRIERVLKITGQTAFRIDYNDLRDVDVLNGLLDWLGADRRIDALDGKLKKQNRRTLRDQVSNYDEMREALSKLDIYGLDLPRQLEADRQPALNTFKACRDAPLLFVPIQSGPNPKIVEWMAALDGIDRDQLASKFDPSSLRDWMAAHPGYRSFSVLRHPVARAHAAFCDFILTNKFPSLRQRLINRYGLPLPKLDEMDSYGTAAHRKAFLAFLDFLKPNLAGQTSIRIDANWASQHKILRAATTAHVLHYLANERTLQGDLTTLAAQIGRTDAPAFEGTTDRHRGRLAEIYDDEIEAATRAAYEQDYLEFGFEGWVPL